MRRGPGEGGTLADVIEVGLTARVGRLPLAFEANTGQTDGRVKFLARGSGYTLFLTANEAVLHFPNAAGRVLRMKLAGVRVYATASGADKLPTR
jgi:hypothetical protein